MKSAFILPFNRARVQEGYHQPPPIVAADADIQGQSMEFRINAKKVALWLQIAAIVLTAAHIAGAISTYMFGHGNLLGLIGTFDLNNENNVPTFFSTFLLVSSAALLAVIAGGSTMAAGETRYWRWLSIIFLYLAIDEDASLHELFIEPVRDFLHTGGLLFFAWVIPYALVVLTIGLLYLGFVLRLPPRTRRLVIASGCIYLTGAIGFELVGGWYLERHAEIENFTYALLVACEEFCEMSGVILFIYALLDFLSDQLKGGSLRILIRSR